MALFSVRQIASELEQVAVFADRYVKCAHLREEAYNPGS